MKRRISSLIAIALLPLIAPSANAQEAPPAAERILLAPTTRSPNYDLVVFADGTTLEGVVVSTTRDEVLVRLTVDGVTGVTRYPKSSVQEIRPGAGGVIPLPPPRYETSRRELMVASAKSFDLVLPVADDPITPGGVYWITLTGKLGQEIAEPPLRAAFHDAKQFQPDVIVIEVDNTPARPTTPQDASEVSPELEKLWMSYDEIYRVEKLLRVPLEEVPEEWGKSPRIVYWVKNALGGLCFLPLTGKEIYFAPDGKLGGMPSPAVREHGTMLRRQHAVAWINHSGYPQPDSLVRGLYRRFTILSVRIEDGKPVLVEGMPTNPNETLLTDDGEGLNADTPEQIAASDGNDLLTLNAHTAQLIGISKGTVATREELLALLEAPDARVIDDRSDSIMEQWSDGVESAYAVLAKLGSDYASVEIEGDHNQRRNARAFLIACAEQIKTTALRWKEGLHPYRIHDLGLPAGYEGIDTARIQQAIDELRLRQSLDRRE